MVITKITIYFITFLSPLHISTKDTRVHPYLIILKNMSWQ